MEKDSEFDNPRQDPTTLYSKLNVVVIDDPCFLKESFWKDSDPSGQGLGLNYILANVNNTTPRDIAPYAGRLDQGWCVNFKSDKPGYLLSFGFDPDRIHHVNIFDALATQDFKEH